MWHTVKLYVLVFLVFLAIDLTWLGGADDQVLQGGEVLHPPAERIRKDPRQTVKPVSIIPPPENAPASGGILTG